MQTKVAPKELTENHSQKTEQGKVFFPHLDLARFVAAGMVVIFHGYEAYKGWFGRPDSFMDEDGKVNTLGEFAERFIKGMSMGVDVFFLISGFLITYLLLVEKDRMGRIHIGKFFARRAFRIWPLYFFLVGISAFWLVDFVDVEHPDYLPVSAFYHNYHQIALTDQGLTWQYPFSHFWSICIEEHFYLFWPFVIAFIPRKHLMNVFIAIVVGTLAYRFYLVYDYTTMGKPGLWTRLYLDTFSRIDVLVVGAMAAVMHYRKPIVLNLGNGVRLALIAVLLFSMSLEFTQEWQGYFDPLFKKYFYVLGIGVLLLDHNFSTNYPRLFKRPGVFHYLGKVSYGIYMYGNIVLLIAIKKIMLPNGLEGYQWFMLIAGGLTLTLPILSYELMEKPILKLKKRFVVVRNRDQ